MIVSRDGKLLDPSLYYWNEEERIFRSSQNRLMIDATGIETDDTNRLRLEIQNNCVVRCGAYCDIISGLYNKIYCIDNCNIFADLCSLIYCKGSSNISCGLMCDIISIGSSSIQCNEFCNITCHNRTLINLRNSCKINFDNPSFSKFYNIDSNKLIKIMDDGEIYEYENIPYTKISYDNNIFKFDIVHNRSMIFYIDDIYNEKLFEAFVENNHTKILMLENDNNRELIKMFIKEFSKVH